MAWPKTSVALVARQEELGRCRPQPFRPRPDLAIGGTFVCASLGLAGIGSEADALWVGAALVDREGVPAAVAIEARAGAPYEVGLLALREGEALEAVVRCLRSIPDLLLVNATGRDHPRRAGLAVELGDVLDIPTVGVTHRPLFATGVWPAVNRGATSPLVLDGEIVGAWVRTRSGCRPLAVHAAWRTDVESAVATVMTTTSGARTPEPLRLARRAARRARAAAAHTAHTVRPHA